MHEIRMLCIHESVEYYVYQMNFHPQILAVPRDTEGSCESEMRAVDPHLSRLQYVSTAKG